MLLRCIDCLSSVIYTHTSLLHRSIRTGKAYMLKQQKEL